MNFKFFLLVTTVCLGAVCPAAERQSFSADQMKVRFWRGGALVDCPDGEGPKVARVGRDWSVEWAMELQKPRALDYSLTYDVYVRCRGEFTLGMYGVERSGYVMGNRSISLADWKEIRIVREKLHPRDYLTTSGFGKPGFISGVTFVAHPESDEELAVRQRNLPGFHIDAAEKASIVLNGIFRRPLTVVTGMGKNEFCPNPSLQLLARKKSGQSIVYPVKSGYSELTVAPGTSDDPVVELEFLVPGGGNRTIAAIAFADPEGADFRIFDWRISCGQVNCFDTISPNGKLGEFRQMSNYNMKREKMFSSSPNDVSFQIRRESTMRKVFEYEIPESWLSRSQPGAVNVSLAGREAEHLQFVLIPRGREEQNLKIAWKSRSRNSLNVSFETVSYIQSARRAYPQLNERTASYPDPLLPVVDGGIRLEGKNLPLWVSIEAPADARPGIYPGVLEIRNENGTQLQRIPLNITVRDFSLPERSQFRTCFFLNRHSMIDYFGIRNNWEAEKALSRKIIRLSAENRLTLMPMLEHRPNWLRPLWTATADSEGNYHFDFSRENELTRMILDEFHGTGYNVSPSPTWDQYFGYMWITDPATGGDHRLNYSMNSPEFEKIYRQFLAAAWENAKKNNWERYAYHYIWDESSGEEWNKLHLLSKQFAPELKNLAVGYNSSRMPENVRDAVDIWCPLTSNFKPEFIAERKRKHPDNESWAYVCVSPKNRYNLFVDHEAFTHRALLWWCRSRKMQGLLYWGVCVWDRAAAACRAGKVWPEAVWEANQFPDANGDGYLLYPDRKNGEIYRSIRLAVLRDGLEDMEYFLMLDEMRKRVGNSTSPTDRKWLEKVKQIEARIPAVIAGESSGSARDFNGELLEEIRREIAGLIEEYIRRNPGTEIGK
ncbi:glycoside hydrolase domain-containing protein [uncultured Victivallis sp.]|uniref:DUF4091 domain-containing protein n=1 Tax=uncultured Victivallis sp. TaxID=354118 RepID=UPI0025E5E884|nr:glycoside hydrolase domain-containing protein [uncultured Victivallis sp.]